MADDEGVIKFECDWRRGAPLDDDTVAPLNAWRRRLYGLRLIGFDERERVGYGNLSIRDPDDPATLIITGTQTGHLPELTGAHYSRVTAADLAANRVCCVGPAAASSETLTHAAVYGLAAHIGAVVHVHDDDAWAALRGRGATTADGVAYGTVEMARELERLYREDLRVARQRLIVMGGHRGGLIGFGDDLDAAGEAILRVTRPCSAPGRA